MLPTPTSPPSTRKNMLAVDTFRLPTFENAVATPPTSPSPSVITPLSNPRPHLRPKRKPCAEDLAKATRELVSSFQRRTTELSLELEAARDALAEARRPLPQVQLPTSPTSPASFQFPTEAGGVARLREDVKRLRAQAVNLARSLKERERLDAQVRGDLEKERQQRKQAEQEVVRLSTANLTLLEHNQLLAGRDATLQNELSVLISRSSQSGHSRRQSLPVNNPTSTGVDRRTPSAPRPVLASPVSFESPAELRSALVSAQDRLHVTERQLFASESRSTILTSRILHLQKNMNLCVDQSADALHVERSLRNDIEERLAFVDGERQQAVSQLKIEKQFADAWRRQVHQHRKGAENTSRRSSLCLKDLALENLTSRDGTHRRNQYSQSSIQTSSVRTPPRKTRPQSFASPASTLVTISPPAQTRKHGPILALTLSKRPGVAVTLKSDASSFVDIVHSYNAETTIY